MNKQTAVEWLVEELKKSTNYRGLQNIGITHQELIDQAKAMEKQQRQIELPSDEEIKQYINSTPYYGHCTSEYCEGIEDGIKWILTKIQGGNNEQQ